MTRYDDKYINDMVGNMSWNTTLYKVSNEIDNAVNKAIVNNDISRVKFLLNINFYQCSDNNIKLAINNDKPEILKILLEKNKNRDYYALLKYAIELKNNSIIDVIVDVIVKKNTTHYISCDYTQLVTCTIRHNHCCVFKRIFKDKDLLGFINYFAKFFFKYAQICKNNDALNHAVYNNSMQVVKVLLEFNADVNTDMYGKTSLLQYASKYNYIFIVKKLLQTNTLWDFIETSYEELEHNYFSYAYENAIEENNTEIVNLLKNFAIKQFPISLPGDVIINIIVNYIGNDNH